MRRDRTSIYIYIAITGLVNNYRKGEGGLQNGRGGQVKFYPHKKGIENV